MASRSWPNWQMYLSEYAVLLLRCIGLIAKEDTEGQAAAALGGPPNVWWYRTLAARHEFPRYTESPQSPEPAMEVKSTGEGTVTHMKNFLDCVA